MSFDYDLFVIGAGPGGHAAAQRAANYGVRVAIAEPDAVGGVCVNRGCVPMELLDNAAALANIYEDAASYGWNVIGSANTPTHNLDWSRFMAVKDREIHHLSQVHTESLRTAGAELLEGKATFLDAHTLQIQGRRITADKILIAVGAKPVKPKQIEGVEHAITSREMFCLQRQPQKLAILGGGYIGVGFASSLSSLGTHITLIERDHLVLPGWDEDICKILRAAMRNRGLQIYCGTEVKAIKPVSEGLQLMLAGETSEPVVVDTVLCATGRIPNTDDLGLENAGVQVSDKGAIVIDENYQTTQANIFAVGDCTGQVELTPVAVAQGRAFADTQFGNKPWSLSYEYIPAYIAAQPEVAMIGLTEEKAREQFGDAVRSYCTQFQPLFYSLTKRDQQTLMKLVVNQHDSERVLGAHMVGDHAADIIQSLALAIRMGATKQDFDATIGIHPTIAEEFFTLH